MELSQSQPEKLQEQNYGSSKIPNEAIIEDALKKIMNRCRCEYIWYNLKLHQEPVFGIGGLKVVFFWWHCFKFIWIHCVATD